MELTMKKIEAIVRPSKLEPLKEALTKVDIKGMTVSEVHGVGNQGGWKEYYRGTEVLVNMLPKVKFEIVTNDDRVQELLKVIIATARTGEVGDGKIFVSNVDEVVRIRTEESGEVAI
jgi:nitrogen regulatory protein P-II 1